ncbi:hypothetical protein [Pseudomonas phage PIP]|nr:hypothetical protein [Pseudomonas phage PIP]
MAVTMTYKSRITTNGARRTLPEIAAGYDELDLQMVRSLNSSLPCLLWFLYGTTADIR